MRDSFVFYRSFLLAINEMPDDVQLKLFKAITEFALNEVDISSTLSGIEKAIFELIRPQIVANNTKYENGKKGGRPRRNSTDTPSLDNKKTTPPDKTEISFDEIEDDKKEILLNFAKKMKAKNPLAYIRKLLDNGDFKQILNDELTKINQNKKDKKHNKQNIPPPTEEEIKQAEETINYLKRKFIFHNIAGDSLTPLPDTREAVYVETS